MPTATKLRIVPATPARWPDLETLFGKNGACAGCWCMWWRMKRSVFNEKRGDGTKRALRKLVTDGPPPGLIAYDGRTPVGWCALAPRADYPVLERSRVLAPVDDQPVWSVVCFFVARTHRKKGMTVALLEAAAAHAAKKGARIVEGYPVEPRAGKTADAFAYTGLASAFRKAGFEETLRRSETRPIMRRAVARGSAAAPPQKRKRASR
jgi:GNAT superfamily N-acetyltransferase